MTNVMLWGIKYKRMAFEKVCMCARRLCTCLSDPEPTAISSSARRFSSSAIYRETARKRMAASDNNDDNNNSIPRDVNKYPRAHLPAFCLIHQVFWHVYHNMKPNTCSSSSLLERLFVRSSTSVLFTLADSLNFSCSGLLCSSYMMTPSGPLVVAGTLPSPAA